MPHAVVFTPEAEEQLIDLYGFIAEKSSPEIAARFTDEIVTCCESLSTFPLRGGPARSCPPWPAYYQLQKARRYRVRCR